jgi:DNA-directed DNA polymerase III PolC
MLANPNSRRSIVHLDADAFFASVEQAADPRLRGKPIAVGGEKRGIIASASYEARKFGIYTPIPTLKARRLCPQLILLPGDFEKYELFSRLMFSYAYDFTPDVEIGSVDEGYFDLTGAHKPAVSIAETIRRAIRQALKLSVSEGIAANKLVSQIASKLKKPSAFEFVQPGGEPSFLAPLANQWLPGIGPKTAGQLNAAGLARIGQIAHTPIDLLNLLVGGLAPQLHNFALGIDERPVIPVRAPARSYGEQETFAADTTDEEFLEATLRRMADKLMAKVRADGKSVRTLTVKVRYNDMDEEQAGESLCEPTDLETDIYSKTSALLRKAWQRRVSLRLVSLKLSNVYDSRFRGALALDASARQHAARQRLADTMDELRQKYGRAVLFRGHDFVLRARNGRGEEPSARSESRNPTRCDGATARREAERNPKAKTRIPRNAYRLAAVQRQRLGNSFARITASPGPELRFRMQEAKGDPKSEIRRPKEGRNPRAEVRTVKEPAPLALRNSEFGSRPSFGFRSSAFGFYTPLNVHSYYSFLDSALSIKAIVKFAKVHELPAIALTDKNNLHGAVEFAQAAAEAGIKPIIGAELDWQGQRVCLYVQNEKGYHNLCRILSQREGPNRDPKPEGRNPKEIRNPKAETQIAEFKTQGARCKVQGATSLNYVPAELDLRPSAFGSRPSFGLRISDLGPPTDGLLAVSPEPALAQFFPDRFYLEVNNLDALSRLTPHASRTTLPAPRPLPCVASLPVHYALPSDRWKYDIVQSIRTLTLLRQQHPEKRLDGDYHFRSVAEMRQLFAGHPELLAHSREIADRCSFTFSLGQPQFPSYRPADGSTPAASLRRLVMDGLQRRYPQNHARLKPQLEEELAIIMDVGYEEYFLVMWDILQECRRRGIEWITRGSAADSLACYCLEISGVCPIRFDLYFRRFLNKERMALNKLPDIDVDFPHDRKDDVIDLIFERYGPAQVAIVGGFSTFQSRSAFAEVAKVLGVSEYQVRRLTERLPHFSRASELAEAAADTLECRDLPLDQEPYASALQMARFLDGFPRYPKMHPCGLVLSRQPMHEITPTFISAKGYPTTHFDMDSVEAVGLVKMDILAQGGLAVMRDVEEMVQNPKPEGRDRDPKSEGRNPKEGRSPKSEIRTSEFKVQDSRFEVQNPASSNRAPSAFGLRPSFGFRISALGFPSPLGPFDDPRVWNLIASGQARAVHHIESPAMISLCKMCNVRDIDTLIAIVSVIRPGAANESKKMEFARRYQRLSPVHYPHPSLEPCLRSTYGLVVYEEHILQICEAFAGLPPGRADILRRALAKDKNELINQIQIEFADCARKRGRTEAQITEVWDLVVGFRGYAFCKAHSTAYGVEAYQSAWLKLHYPAEFMAAVLTNGKGFYSPLVYVLECHRLGIPLLPPAVNHPGPQFIVTTNKPPAGVAISNYQFPIINFQLSRNKKIRVPVLLVRGLTTRTKETILSERDRGPFSSLADFFLRVRPLPEEMEALIRVGAFDEFGQSRTRQYWEFKALGQTNLKPKIRDRDPRSEGRSPKEGRNPKAEVRNTHPISDFGSSQQLWLFPPGNLERLPSVPLSEPHRLQRLRAEEELLGYPVSGHPLELFPDIAWDSYCPINRLGDHLGEQIVTCGLVIEQRLFHQVTGEPMKFITIADWTGIIETELFAKTYQSYGLNTIRYRVLEITATVEPFENGRGHTLRVLRAGKPRTP